MTTLPCPFCGASRRNLTIHRVHDDIGTGMMIRCGFCSAQGPVARVDRGDIETAIELWNDRSGKAAHAD